MKSKLFKLHIKDGIKGLLLAVITAILTGMYQIVQTGAMITSESFKPVLIASFGAAIAYVLKNWLTNSNDEFLKKEQ